MAGRPDLASNPFSALFPTLSVAEEYVESQQQKGGRTQESPSRPDKSFQPAVVDLSQEGTLQDVQELNRTIEGIFLVTLNKFSVLGGEQKQLVFLSGLAEVIGPQNQSWLDLASLEQALFERLMLTNPADHLVSEPGCRELHSAHLIETGTVRYLAECYRRCQAARIMAAEMKEIILQNFLTAFKVEAEQGEDLFPGTDLGQQLTDLLFASYEVEPHLQYLMSDLAAKILEDERDTNAVANSLLKRLAYPVLDNIKTRVEQTTMILFSSQTVLPLQYLISCPVLANLTVLHSFPRSANPTGKSFEESLLGSILAKSPLPGSDTAVWDYFAQPSSLPASAHGVTETRIWAGLESVHSVAADLLRQLLKISDDTKHFTLLWLGDCLAANQGRGKMWTHQMGSLLASGLVSDGFMLNLGSALLRLFSPLTEGTRMGKVDPSYTAKVTAVGEERRLAHHHMQHLAGETCLVGEAGQHRETRPNYNFPTEIFFLCHKCLDLGFRPVQEKFIKLNQELGRLQAAYRDTAEVGGPAAEQVQERMELAMQRYLTYKAALLEPSTMDQQSGLIAATAGWLVQLTTGSPDLLPAGPVTSPAPALTCVPEFVLENLCEHLLLVKRFNPVHFEQIGPKLGSLLMVILCYIDQPGLVRNPHLRARLAESLECLLPGHSVQGQPNMLGSYQRQALFQDHPYSLRIAEAVLHVFVSIEETGQSVDFEQKFSYRRPMYDVIKYIWEMEEFKQKMKELAEQAEVEIESEQPPLFLRFLNLLINDAIFLLDEGLGFMKQLQEKEAERPNWTSLPAQERAEAEGNFHHVGQMARYHNIMGGETIAVLGLLTSSITAVITHQTMADRLAAMLNYFLATLTGPGRRSFKVSNLEKYNFRPGEVVSEISQIYLNLQESPVFIRSISSDGRSYSETLFSGTEAVLVRVGRADLAAALGQVGKRAGEAKATLAAEEELLADCPDDFLCPIMSVIMMDPVRLPASKQTVDRSTIARHLLSDQSDPFNRAPLTMDQVTPDLELRERVRAWVEERSSAGSKH